MDAATREKCPHAQGGGKQDAQPSYRKQDEAILPGRRLGVKTYVSTIVAKDLDSCGRA
jgi:hypothetical protein